jgi:hypothetical protein
MEVTVRLDTAPKDMMEMPVLIALKGMASLEVKISMLYFKPIEENQCTSCKDDKSYYIKLSGFFVLQIGLMAFNIV